MSLCSQPDMDFGIEIRRPELLSFREQHLRDLLSLYGLDLAASKDVLAVVHEVLAALFQSVPKEEVDRLLAIVHRNISTPSPTLTLRLDGHLSPLKPIPEDDEGF